MTRVDVRLRALVEAAELELAELVLPDGAGEHGRWDGPLVRSVVMTSADVTAGSLFACTPGSHVDGHDFAPDAVRRGAVALLCERRLGLAVPQVVVPSVREAIGPVSAAFWGRPARAMTVVGVTGTNGKTTTCALLAAVFEANGWKAGVVGTLTGTRTTPEAPALQRRLAELRDGGARAVAMEVSSHALSQARVAGTELAAGVFTNLSQDHLDYHGTMEAYFEAKAMLFSPEMVRLAVVNREGPWGAKLTSRLEGGPVPFVTYSPAEATEIVLGRQSSSFTWRGERLALELPGRFNVTNAVAAATTARELGIGWDAIVPGLASAAPVRGRFEPVEAGQPFAVLVDFAHTPAALAEALRAARDIAGPAGTPVAGAASGGRVIVVFGAGGDRDRDKRPLMGKVAAELADVVVVTSDNPRNEKPLTIIEEVASGIATGEPLVEVDRAKAISGALGMARPGDVVLIAGKGHETVQDHGTYVEEFDDAEVARRALERIGAASGGGARGPR